MIPAVDMNLKDLWDAVTDEGRKEIKGDMWNLNRYISNVGTNRGRGKAPTREQQEHYVLAVNEYYNKNWNLLQKEDAKLLWFLLCMCNYDGKTTFFHEWIPLKRSSTNKKLPMLLKWNPTMKERDVELLAELITDKEFKELAKSHGMEDSEIKKIVK
jgi:hypothetical protein